MKGIERHRGEAASAPPRCGILRAPVVRAGPPRRSGRRFSSDAPSAPGAAFVVAADDVLPVRLVFGLGFRLRVSGACAARMIFFDSRSNSITSSCSSSPTFTLCLPPRVTRLSWLLGTKPSTSLGSSTTTPFSSTRATLPVVCVPTA